MGLPTCVFAPVLVGAGAILLFAMSSCATGHSDAVDPQGARSVVVINPVWKSGFDECIDDDAVKTAIQSADLPASRISLTFKEDANTDDIKRVVDCLRSKLQEGTMELDGNA